MDSDDFGLNDFVEIPRDFKPKNEGIPSRRDADESSPAEVNLGEDCKEEEEKETSAAVDETEVDLVIDVASGSLNVGSTPQRGGTPAREDPHESDEERATAEPHEEEVTDTYDNLPGLLSDENGVASDEADNCALPLREVEGAEWCLLEDDGTQGLEQRGTVLLKQQMVARVFRFKSLLQSKLQPQPRVTDGQERGGEREKQRAREEKGNRIKRETVENSAVVSPRGPTVARPIRVPCGLQECEERAEKHGGCSRCATQLCKEHSIEVNASEVDAGYSRWKNRAMAAPDGAMGLAHCDEEVFSLLSDTVVLCSRCHERFVQTVGVLIDRSDRYRSLRSRQKTKTREQMRQSIRLLVPQAERFVVSCPLLVLPCSLTHTHTLSLYVSVFFVSLCLCVSLSPLSPLNSPP